MLKVSSVEQDNEAGTQRQETINVMARVRPQIPNEARHPTCIEVVDDSIIDGHKTQIVVRKDITNKTEQKIYSFEKVLDPEST